MLKNKTNLLLLLLSAVQFLFAQGKADLPDFARLSNSHDILSLSYWGPYSKKYAGISHIPDMEKGLRFDFSVLPGLYRNKLLVPNVRMQSDYYPWKFNNDITSYTYRYELEWKDDVYADVNYHIVDSSAVLVAVRYVNNTSLPRNLNMNMVAYLDFPENYPSRALRLIPGGQWMNAVAYTSLGFAKPRPSDNLVYDGWLRGEVRHSDYIDGRAIGRNFGRNAGDSVSYRFTLNHQLLKGNIILLYRMKANTQVSFRLNGLTNQKINLTGTGELTQITIPYHATSTGTYTLTFTSEGDSGIELNGFMLVPEGERAELELIPSQQNFIPQITENTASKNVILKYDTIANYYGIAWDQKYFEVRQINNDELDVFMREKVHDHTHKVLDGNGKGHYANIFVRPIELDSHDSKTIYALLCTGTYEEVKKRLSEWESIIAGYSDDMAPSNTERLLILPEGDKYLFSREKLKATLMSNIVYPVYTQNSYIRHFTPGKWWNSLYTWDSGFLAIGLSEVNRTLAIECLNAYTTPVGSQSAFIHHGTPVPVQHYAFFDLWNKTQSTELLQYFYPRLKQYYEFLAGRSGSSTTRSLHSNLLKTWDYFYNSGGWDDYPAQMEVHKQKVEKTVAPVSNTAHQIRLAKMLRMAAEALNEKEDIRKYDEDINIFTEALQKYSWNSKSGYFSYVVHDAKGNPIGHFTDPDSGIDYNMGMDGVYPLFSGICTPDQEEILLKKLFSEKHLWTPSGICVVDQSAPYYRIDGYWNGAVWMPHQWFAWKAMLDLGRPDLAFKIAQKALDVYKRETDDSYYTSEHFLAKTGRGAGWHHFSGLSTPVLSWFSSYFKQGTVTTGFEIWIKEQQFNDDRSSYLATLSFDGATTPHARSLVVCMNPSYEYEVTFNGKKVEVSSPYGGLLQITLPSTNEQGRLSIRSVH